MLARTVATALAVTRFDDVLVVSPDRDLLTRATGFGARTLLQRSGRLRAGLTVARDDVVAGGATAIVVLPIDLPFVSVEAVDAVIDALVSEPGPTVVLITDRHGAGTNALALRPPDVIAFAFGRGSRAAHRDGAARAGARYVELGGPLTVDLDTPEDLVFVESTAAERLGVG